jgi:hypothetical protein
VLLLLLNVAQLEFMLKNLFQKLLDDKDDKWNESRSQGAERMSELGAHASACVSCVVCTCARAC